MGGYGKCHECVKFGTMDCPTSSKCMAFDDKPYFKKKPKKKFLLLRLMCKHDYEYAHQYKVNGCMQKHIHYICKKCGHEKMSII